MTRANPGFPPPAGRRSDPTKDAMLDRRSADVACGTCDRIVPTGGAHIVVNYRASGQHQMFCAACCPCNTPGQVRPHRGNEELV